MSSQPFMIHLSRLAPAFMSIAFFALFYHFFVQENRRQWAIALVLLSCLISYRSLTSAG